MAHSVARLGRSSGHEASGTKFGMARRALIAVSIAGTIVTGCGANTSRADVSPTAGASPTQTAIAPGRAPTPTTAVPQLQTLSPIYIGSADGQFMQAGFGAVWVASPTHGLLKVSDSGTYDAVSDATTVLDVGIGSTAVLALAGGASSQLVAVDPKTGRTLRTWPLAAGAKSLVVAGDVAYVDHGTHPATIDRIDLKTGALRSVVLSAMSGSLAGGQALAAGGGLIWGTDGTIVLGLDPADLSVRMMGKVSPSVDNIWFGDGSIWAAGEMYGGGVHRIDPTTMTEAAEVASDAVQIAFSPHGVWVSATAGPAELDPTTAAVIATLSPGDVVAGDSAGLAVLGAEVWVAYKGEGEIQRIKVP